MTRPIGVRPRPVICSLVRPIWLRTVAFRSAGVSGVSAGFSAFESLVPLDFFAANQGHFAHQADVEDR